MGTTRTVYLGQYQDDTAEAIAEALAAADIVWWHKSTGRFLRAISAADWGVRLFVDAGRLDEARGIADRVLADRGAA